MMSNIWPASNYRHTLLWTVISRRSIRYRRAVSQAFADKVGVDTYLQVITAQTVTLANERNQVDILRRRMDASVLLVKALGGGWHIADLPQL
jgi:outer membrane protein TolC